MKSKQEFNTSLVNFDTWKKIAPKFLLLFGGPKKPFKIYKEATETKVVECNNLAHYKHEDNNYYVTAFSTNNDIPIEQLAKLQEQAQNLELDSVRYESMGGSGLNKWWGDYENPTPESYPISNALSDIDNDVYVQIICDIDCLKNYVYVVYALNDGKRYFSWIPDNILK